MRKIRKVVYLALLATVGLLIVLVSPLYALFASVGILAFLSIARQINFYEIILMLKSLAKTVSSLRLEIRARLHTGFREYGDSVENDETSSRNYGFVR